MLSVFSNQPKLAQAQLPRFRAGRVRAVDRIMLQCDHGNRRRQTLDGLPERDLAVGPDLLPDLGKQLCGPVRLLVFVAALNRVATGNRQHPRKISRRVIAKADCRQCPG